MKESIDILLRGANKCISSLRRGEATPLRSHAGNPVIRPISPTRLATESHIIPGT